MHRSRFQCRDCGLGDYETGHLVAADEVYCVVCLEEEGRLIRLHSWEEEGVKPVSAWSPLETALP
jgi:hypothetical protein